MLEAAFWGFATSSSLVIGALIALAWRPPHRAIGLIMGFGTGALISAVAYELIGDAIVGRDAARVTAGLVVGAAVFVGGDWYITRAGGAHRKNPSGELPPDAEDERGPAIVLGTILDGIPESLVLGLILVQGGGASAALVGAVFISNLPEAISATSALGRSHWPASRLLLMWASIVVISAVSAVAGYLIFDEASPSLAADVQAFAGGAILAMLSTAMAPEAYRFGGRWAGMTTVLGFATALALTAA